MVKTVKLSIVSLVSAMLVGATGAYASAPSGPSGQLAGLCGPGLSNGCVTGVCAAVSKATDWSAGRQATFGAAVARLVAAEGAGNPSDADKIQACIAAGPEALRTAFEQGGPPPVSDIGHPNPASPH